MVWELAYSLTLVDYNQDIDQEKGASPEEGLSPEEMPEEGDLLRDEMITDEHFTLRPDGLTDIEREVIFELSVG